MRHLTYYELLFLVLHLLQHRTEYKRHQQTHLQIHLDKWSSNSKADKVSWKPPEGTTQDLLKIFEKYRF
jgi:hypothetical protein